MNTTLNKWQEELNSNLGSKIRWDAVTLQLYSTAACFYEITPLAVVIPESIEDIQNTISVCAEYKIPVLPRGAGSSLSGNSVGRAVILDLTRNFNQVKIISENLVHCGVGVVLNNLRDHLKPLNKKFAPDPSSGNVCVIGGMLGNNSGGPHTIKHGNMYKHVDEVDVILSNGKLFKAKNIKLTEIAELDDFDKPYYERVKELLEKYKSEIFQSRPNSTKNASGYQVWDILTETHLNLALMMVGSEGTLGVFSGAKLKVIPTVKRRGIISFYFSDIAQMGIAVKHLRALGASAIEFVDQSFIQLALSFKPELKEFLPEHVKYLLYVEFESDDEKEIEHLFEQAKLIISEKEKLAEIGLCSTNETEIVNIFKIRKAATVILNKIQGKEKPVPFVEDAAIHPDVFSDFLIDLSRLLENYTFKYAVFGHAGDGNLHLRPILNFKDEKSFADAEDLMHKFVELVYKFKGTLSGEHGDGRLRTPFLKKSFPKLLPLFKEIKHLFDPIHIMNPDIIVPKNEYEWTKDLRYSSNYNYENTFSDFDKDAWKLEIEKCHGCGTCREYCPVFIATGKEEATARAKANILRGIISGKISRDEINTDNFYEIMNYCLNCGQCLTDCPTEVNIPGMAVIAKQELHKKRPYKFSEFILQRGKLVSQFASSLTALSNYTLKIPVVRKTMQGITGIDERRIFPTFSKFKPKKKILESSKRKVVIWSGCSAQFNDSKGELEASIQIFEKLGYQVILPEWKCCNIAKLSYGNIKDSIDDIDFNASVLMKYVEDKIPIIFTSASCGYAFMREYFTFFPELDELKLIAAGSYDIHDYLVTEFQRNGISKKLLTINKKIVYHEPCHLKSQKNKYGPKDLLKMIPGLTLLDIQDNCCGIAGTFGMKEENFDLSMEIGSKLFSEVKRVSPDLVLSGCGTCQIQINQGTELEVIHPVKMINDSFNIS